MISKKSIAAIIATTAVIITTGAFAVMTPDKDEGYYHGYPPIMWQMCMNNTLTTGDKWTHADIEYMVELPDSFITNVIDTAPRKLVKTSKRCVKAVVRDNPGSERYFEDVPSTTGEFIAFQDEGRKELQNRQDEKNQIGD